MIEKEILNILKLLKRKYYKNKSIKYISYGLLIYSIAIIIIISISKVLPIPYIISKSIWLLIASMLSIITFIIYKNPNNTKFAKILDSLELKERVSTSLELIDHDDKFSMIQKKDTLERLKCDEIREKIKTPYPKRIFISTIIIFTISTIMLNIDTESVYVAKEIEEVKQVVEEEKEKIEEVIEEVKKDDALTEDEKREIEENLRNLKRSLEEIKDLKDAKEDIRKSKDELEELKNELNEKAIDNLKDLEKSIDNENMKQVLENLANNLDNDEKVDENMDILSKEINNAINNENSPSKSLEDAIETLENMAEKAEGASNSTSGNGNKNSSGSGAGSGSGKGAGQGGGVGNGSNNDLDSDKVNESSGGDASKGKGGGSEVKDYEKIYTPKNRDGESYDAEISGINSNDDNDGDIKIKKFGDKVGESIPYNEVLKSYKETAYERLDGGEIPSNMKNIIKKYFTELE